MTEAEANSGTLLGRMLGPYGVLRGNRSLQLIFTGQAVSSFGDWLYILALGILAYEITGSATVVAVLTFARLLPYAVLHPFSGVLADRGNRKVLKIVADLGRPLHARVALRRLGEDALDRLPSRVPIHRVLEPLQAAMSSVLPAVACGEEAGDSVYRGAEVVPVALLCLPGVERHSSPARATDHLRAL